MERRELVIPTKAPPGSSTPTWHTAAWLTVPRDPRRSELQILVHGANSDHRYWDFPVDPHRYSYVKWAAEHGHATLMIDRIGCGASTHPPGTETTIEAQADTLHQVVTAMRGGLADSPAFSRIVLVGASLGSVVAGVEAATYTDVDAVVLTAYLPKEAGQLSEEQLVGLFQPAVTRRPELRGLIDEGYVVPLDGMGESWMYRAGAVDEDVIATAEQIAGTSTLSELAGATKAGATVRQSAIPTLVLVGQYDPLMFGPDETDSSQSARRVAEESAKNFEFQIVPDTGHPINLHYTAHDAFQRTHEWIDRQRPEAIGTRPASSD
jgi:pimeloyl-ACP methyl ester carboxylesterase